jgi:copper chaperone NosL
MQQWARGSLFCTLLLVACAKGPAPISFGEDVCEWCTMKIADPHFAAQLRAQKGKVHKFDSVECLAAFSVTNNATTENTQGRWVSDYVTQKWIPVSEAFFLRTPRIRSPMGVNLTAYATRKGMEAQREASGGDMLVWDDVTQLVQTSGFVRDTGRAPR